MHRSPAQTDPHEIASRWLRESLDADPPIKHDAWKTSALAGLGLKALSYAGRWITGEQQVPLAAIIATASAHPRVAEHVARNLAALVGKVLADEPRVTDVLNDMHAFMSLGGDAGRVMDAIARSLGDGVITPSERLEMLTALRALGERVQSLIARLEATRSEGVEGVRGLSVVPR